MVAGREEQVLRRGEPGADGGGDGPGDGRGRGRLHAGDDGGRRCRAVGSYPIEVTLGTQSELRRDQRPTALLTVNKARGDAWWPTRRASSTARRIPALTAVVTRRGAGGDAVAYTLATTAVRLSRRRKLPDRGHARHQSELRGDQDRCAADGQQGRGDGGGRREERFYGAANPTLTAVVTGAGDGRGRGRTTRWRRRRSSCRPSETTRLKSRSDPIRTMR